MLEIPTVSVVMSVYNGEKYISRSIDSILAQKDVDFEFIIVNDGSTDKTGEILETYANKHTCIKIFEQKNKGLTKALIKGCNMASGKFIARQDADDESFPGRLKKQVDYLNTRPDVNLASCWSVCVGPEDEELFRVKREENPEEATLILRDNNVKNFKGINAHGSAMYRSADYRKAGGYRSEFYFAQDLDLFLRLTDFGYVGFVPEYLYKFRYIPSCISTSYASRQIELTKLMLEMTQNRIRGKEEMELLKKAKKIRPKKNKYSRRKHADGLYFIGKCLLDQNDERGISYLKDALKKNIFQLKALFFIFSFYIKFIRLKRHKT